MDDIFLLDTLSFLKALNREIKPSVIFFKSLLKEPMIGFGP